VKICVDVQAAVSQRAGVGRYTRALVEHLGAAAAPDSLQLFYFDFRGNGEPLNVGNAGISAIRWCPGRLAQYAWKTIAWPPFDWLAGPADVYHFPNFIIPPLSKGRSIVTIHDASFLRLPDMAEAQNLLYLRARIGDTVRRADAIITVSSFSAEELISLLNVPPEKISVISEGISPRFAAPAADATQELLSGLNLDRPYILTVGTLEPRKNVPFLVEVFEKMTRFDGDLVIVGMPGWKYQPIIDRMKSSAQAGRIKYLRYVSDEQLRALYSGAELFMFPSLYEGFGFPPLEAMACGTPVISSGAGSLREVLGDAAVVVPVYDSNLWVEQAYQWLGNRSMCERGKARAARYTWKKAAQETWNVYRKVAG